jgi:very-short-patch-repair endonuclease
MNCPKCNERLLAGKRGEECYYYCPHCVKEVNVTVRLVEGVESEVKPVKRKKPTDAQKAVREAQSKDSAVLFSRAWEQLSRRDPFIKLVPEYAFHPRIGWRFDFAFLPWMLAIEVDGGQWKPGGGRHGGDGDKEKMNQASILGWRVMHFSPKQLRDDPLKCVRLVESALGRKERE